MSISPEVALMTTFLLNKISYLGRSIGISGLVIFTISSCGSGGSDQEQDPLVEDEPVAYVKRPVPTDNDGVVESENVLLPTTFNGGAALFIRDRASQAAGERNITDAVFGAGTIYDVKDVETSYDGRKLLFTMRAPQIANADEADQPKWRLWEYDLDDNTLSRVFGIDDDISGQFHDISPAYLPDGRIVFASTRQVRNSALLFNTGQPAYKYTVNIENNDEEIFNLHVYDPVNDPSGNFIQQITFGHSHELQPTVLQNGRIAFLRSEMAEDRNKLSIYTVNIDGSNMRILYGYHSQNTGRNVTEEDEDGTTFIDLRELSDGTLSAILQARESAVLGGDIIQINSEGFTDIIQPTAPNAGDSGLGQRSITEGIVNLDDDISTHGFFNSAYPINGEQRFLVSWNPCRLMDDNDTPDDASDDIILACSSENLANAELEAAPPFFGLWLYDADAGTQNPIAIGQEGEMYTDAVIMEDRPLPQIAESILDEDLEADNLAILNIRSVYDISDEDATVTDISALADPNMTSAADRPARFLRLLKPVGLPSDAVQDLANTAFGLRQERGMREIIGYTPIEPDGSVRVAMPADVAFHFDIVDANGENIGPPHRNNLQLRAGETYNCTGCHTDNSTEPHGRISAEAPSANGGAVIGEHFINTRYTSITGVEDGDTMAEVYALATGEERIITTGVLYTDDWSDPAPVDPPISLLYANMPFDSVAPVSEDCQNEWFAECSITINYPEHIQALWELSRPSGSCISCHTTNGDTQAPAGQLELTDQPSTAEADHITSYRELLQQDSPLIINPAGSPTFLPLFVLNIVDGVQQFYLDVDGNQILDAGGVPIRRVRIFSAADNDNVNDIYVQRFSGAIGDVYLDSGGAPILDAGGNQIEFMVQIASNDIPPSPVMRLSNAAGSRFFDKLEGTAGTDHSSFMSPNELRLVREWLDIGGQYYNDPFDDNVPVN